ncbi:unnamed protein product (macronuclear) [Paramecium tetraurelia]|uniref:Transmembrane protein n=1 Tax=Paramecium tetraurelia TaxID=5888 RepID=A0D7Q0_PARTE|nr:uncharacterized protein GSPATT00014034001 [Paramecium tetraurelia]CAK79067.1 unnamed protein product [Paramecium tetraurelia]|eukprot:XP_001446464.1 hypothetical protein (macronuclear) [Paramecium tetraurelia strain d4-2]
MASLFKQWKLQFTNPIYEAEYQDFLNNQRLFFLRALLITIMLSCFFAMLVFIVQNQSAYLVSFMAVLFILHIVFLFFSYKLIYCLKLIMTILYASYITAAFYLAYIGFKVPLFDFGLSCGLLFSCALQYCDNRFKVIFLFIANWLALVLFVQFELAQIQYLVFSISMFILLGIMTYLIEYNRRSQFLLTKKLETQKSILYEFTNDSLFAIMYDENSRSFQLSFANKKFESLYKTNLDENNVKEFLRNQSIINRNNQSSNRSLNNKQIHKQINLEEYLFELVQQKLDYFNQDRFLIETNNGKEKYLINILKFENQKTQFFLSIKENQAKHQIEKYETKIKSLNTIFISVLLLISHRLERLYKQILNLKDDLQENTDLIKELQCNIQYSLIYLKNYMIYLQKEKMSFLKQQFEQFKVQKLIEELSEYFHHYSKQYHKQFQFVYLSEAEQQSIFLNTRLLTQLLINIFNKILIISNDKSSIQLQIDRKLIQYQLLKDNNLTRNQELQLMQFSYIFVHKDQIDNLEFQFSQSINLDSQYPFQIECVVNQIILKILSPYSSIQIQSIYQEKLQNHRTTLTFYIYTDQTQLDPSFTKYVDLYNL